MEEATPIYQLQMQQQQQPVDNHSSRKDPVEMMSYNDILKNMSDHKPSEPKPIVTHQQPTVQPQPTVQSPQQHIPQVPSADYYHPHAPSYTKSTPNNIKREDDQTTFQNEMLALLGVYIIVHTQQFQQTLRTKVPGMFQENGSPSVVGILMNGVLVIVAWNLFKRFLIKYMKDM